MTKLRTFLSRFCSDHSGTIAVVTALSLVALVGFAGLGVETSQWYTEKRGIQAAADDAALSAAVAYGQGNTTTYVTEGKSVAGSNGFVDGVNNVTIVVSKPPQNGTYSNNNSAVEVTIVAPAKPILSAMFISQFDITGSSVALINGPASNGCVLALDPLASGAGTISGTSTSVALKNCSFDVNSKSGSDLVMTGGSSLSAADVILGGTNSVSSNSTITTTGGIRTNQPTVADPYASRTMPTPTHCDYHFNNPINSSQTLQPGVYCGGLTLNGGATVTLAPGVYIIDKGDFTMHGNSTLQGNGVTIILTSSSTINQIGNIIIDGGATLNLTAPPTGPYAGMVFWQDGRAADSNKDNFTGGSGMNITGAIYTPSQTVNYSGGNTTGGNGCTQLIAKDIIISGNSEFDNNCSGIGVSPITATTSLATLAQ